MLMQNCYAWTNGETIATAKDALTFGMSACCLIICLSNLRHGIGGNEQRIEWRMRIAHRIANTREMWRPKCINTNQLVVAEWESAKELNHDANNRMKNGYLIIFVEKNLWSNRKIKCRLCVRVTAHLRSHPYRTNAFAHDKNVCCLRFSRSKHKFTSMMNIAWSHFKWSRKLFDDRKKCMRRGEAIHQNGALMETECEERRSRRWRRKREEFRTRAHERKPWKRWRTKEQTPFIRLIVSIVLTCYLPLNIC